MKGWVIGGPQTQARPRGMRIPILGLIGVSIVGLFRLRSRNKRHRPTADELMQMSDADFASFVSETGLTTVTTAGLAAMDGRD